MKYFFLFLICLAIIAYAIFFCTVNTDSKKIKTKKNNEMIMCDFYKDGHLIKTNLFVFDDSSMVNISPNEVKSINFSKSFLPIKPDSIIYWRFKKCSTDVDWGDISIYEPTRTNL